MASITCSHQWVCFGRGDKGDVNVRMGRHFAPPIPAHRHDGQPLARAAVDRGIDMFDHMIVDHAQQLIDQESLSLGAIMARAGPFQQAPVDLFAPIGQRLAQQFDDRLPGKVGLAPAASIASAMAMVKARRSITARWLGMRMAFIGSFQLEAGQGPLVALV
jgi:hypothetical protein